MASGLALFGLVTGVVLLLVGVATFVGLEPVIKSQIEETVVISPESQTYENWVNISNPVYMQFWLFNVTNVQDVLAGGKPNVSEIGPFTYRETRQKFDITFNNDSTVNFRNNIMYHFEPDMSVGPTSVMVTAVNPLIPVLSQMIKHINPTLKSLLANFLRLGFKEELFLTKTVEELLWGYEDQALKTIMKITPNLFETSKIGYFTFNNTDDGIYTVYTGKDNIENVAKMKAYNDQTELTFWTTPWANMINGTDGAVTPPFFFDQDKAYIFVSQICRSIYGVFVEDVSVRDIKLRRFGADSTVFANVSTNPDNIGFCTPKESCMPAGLLNTTSCQNGYPIIFSFPHFLDAAEEVQSSVDGISPAKEEHQTSLDVEPWTGMILQVAKRLQINILVEQDDNIPQTDSVRTLAFPVLWINESSVIDDDNYDTLRSSLFLPLEVAETARIWATAVGGLLVLVSMVMILRRRKKKYTFPTTDDSDKAPIIGKSSSPRYSDLQARAQTADAT